jgi:hypothetical protein
VAVRSIRISRTNNNKFSTNRRKKEEALNIEKRLRTLLNLFKLLMLVKLFSGKVKRVVETLGVESLIEIFSPGKTRRNIISFNRKQSQQLNKFARKRCWFIDAS